VGARGEIAALIRESGTTYVLCDGGDKPRELAVFAKHLKPGDLIAAHDCGTEYWPWREIKREQGDAIAKHESLTSWRQEAFDLAGWLVYRR